MRWYGILFGVLVLVPGTLRAVGFQIDLGIRPEDIVITPPPSQLTAGQNARIYATVHNFGERDAKGLVAFYQGPILLGEPQPVSVRAQGFADEVFMDFIVPDGPFNILAKLQAIRLSNAPGSASANSSDENSSNNEAVTPLIAPRPDQDKDSISDDLDNCGSIPNSSQLDTDNDRVGDECDPDDDNDGLADIDETARGTNPKNPDTDNDGVSDAKDRRPLIADVSPLTAKDAVSVVPLTAKDEVKKTGVPVVVAPEIPKPIEIAVTTKVGVVAKAVNKVPEVALKKKEESVVEKLPEDIAEESVIVAQAPASKIPPSAIPKLWAVAGFSAIFAGVFSFLALRMKTPRE